MSRWGWMLLCTAVACNGGKDESGGDRVDTILALEGDVVAGKTVYDSNCSVCHAEDGSGASGPALAGIDADSPDVVSIIIDGDGSMPAFESLPDQDIADCYAYILTL